MKKKKWILLCVLSLFFVSISFASAFDITLKKSEYYSQETLQAEIPDVFIDNLKLENLGIYKSGDVHKSPAVSGLIKDENKYYYYAVLPSSPGNYYLKISGIRYYQNNQQKEDPITKNFTISSANSSYLSFNPGAVTTTKNFSVTIRSYNAVQEISVDFQPSGFSQSFSLGYGSERIIYIPISGISNFTRSEVKINSYSIPVIIAPEITSVKNETPEPNFTEFIEAPLEDLIAMDIEYINATLLEGKNYFKLTIVNKDEPVKGINISSSGSEISVYPTRIEELSKEETIDITLDSEESFEGWINITSDESNDSIILLININITQESEDIEYNIIPENLDKKCSQQGGIKCDYASGEKCTGSELQASDGWCCIGGCKIESKSSGWIWGVLILVVLAAAGYFIYEKSKQGPMGDKFKQIFQKKTEAYEKKISPSKEISGSLSKA